MAYSVVPKTRRDGEIELIDGTGPAVTLIVSYEEGNLSIDVPSAYSTLMTRDRGDISSVRKQEQNVITGSFSFNLRQFTDTGLAGSIIDFINKTGFYNQNESTGSTGTPYIEQFCIDIKYTVEGTDHGDPADSVATLTKCEINSYAIAEGDPTTVTLNFTCYGGVTYL